MREKRAQIKKEKQEKSYNRLRERVIIRIVYGKKKRIKRNLIAEFIIIYIFLLYEQIMFEQEF